MPEDLGQIEIPCSRPVNAQVRPPGSKSITNRALVCASLANGVSQLSGILDSEDTQVMVTCLEQLGLQIDWNKNDATLQIQGCGGGIPSDHAELHVVNSGTTIRFLTSLVTLGNGTYRLDGIARMRQRPISDLLDALNQLGGSTKSENGDGCPPPSSSRHRGCKAERLRYGVMSPANFSVAS